MASLYGTSAWTEQRPGIGRRYTQADQRPGIRRRRTIGVESEGGDQQTSDRSRRGYSLYGAPITGPTLPQIEASRQEFRGGLGEMITGRETAPGEAWRRIQPMMEAGLEQMRGYPESAAVRGTIERQLSPATIEGERSRLMGESLSALRAEQDLALQRLREEAPNMPASQRRRYIREIRQSFARMKSLLPVEIDKQIAQRMAQMLRHGTQYALGMYGPEAATRGRLLEQAGGFALSPEVEARMRQALMAQAAQPTRAAPATPVVSARQREPSFLERYFRLGHSRVTPYGLGRL